MMYLYKEPGPSRQTGGARLSGFPASLAGVALAVGLRSRVQFAFPGLLPPDEMLRKLGTWKASCVSRAVFTCIRAAS